MGSIPPILDAIRSRFLGFLGEKSLGGWPFGLKRLRE